MPWRPRPTATAGCSVTRCSGSLPCCSRIPVCATSFAGCCKDSPARRRRTSTVCAPQASCRANPPVMPSSDVAYTRVTWPDDWDERPPMSLTNNEEPTTSNRFFVTGGTLGPEAACYVTRRADADLYDGLSHGEFCYVLTARQM